MRREHQITALKLAIIAAFVLLMIFSVAAKAQTVVVGGSGGATINPTNGVPPTRSNATTFRDATSTDIINLFSTCSGTQYLGADGACHATSVGITNSAGANVIPKSDGTNIIASNLSDSGTAVQSKVGINYFDDTGAADAYVITPSPSIGAYATGQTFVIKAVNPNATTTPTLNVNGLGAKTITKNGGAALAANDIKAGQVFLVVYDGTNMQMQSLLGNAPSGTGVPSGSTTSLQTNSGASTFATLAGSITDNLVTTAAANSTPLQISRAYTTGSTTFTMHIIDLLPSITSSVTQKVNTMASVYSTDTFAGVGGCAHCSIFVARHKDNGVSAAAVPIDEFNNFWSDMSDAGISTTPVTASTHYWAVNNVIQGASAQNVWGNHAGFRNNVPTFTSPTTATIVQGFVTDSPPVSGSNINTFYAFRAGGCASSGDFLAGCFAGGAVKFKSFLDQTMTLAALPAQPDTTAGPNGYNVSNFVNSAITATNIKLLLTGQASASGSTLIGLDSTVDSGNAADNPALMVALRAQCRDTGGSGTIAKCIGLSIQAVNTSAVTVTDMSGIEVGAQTVTGGGTNINIPYAIKTLGPNDIVQLAGPTKVKRYFANQGTAIATGDIAISGGWGSTASKGSIVGFDQAGALTITSAGTGQGASPTVTITFHDGTWTNAPVCEMWMNGGTGTQTVVTNTTESATAPVFTFLGTPVAASTYRLAWNCTGI